MLSITVIILSAYVALVPADELAVNQDELLDKVVDKLIDRVISMSSQHEDLDETTLAKTQGTTHGKSAAINLVQPLAARGPALVNALRPFSAASASPLAMSRSQLGGVAISGPGAQDISLFQGVTARGPVSTNALGSYTQSFSASAMSQSQLGGMTMSVPAMQDSLRKYGAPSSPFEKLALTALAASRDVSMAAQVNEVYSSMDSESQAKVADATKAVIVKASTLKAEDLPGATAPMGFWDPLGKSKEEGADIYFYREVEVKHGRWGMLATLGIATTELGFRPFFGADMEWKNAVLSHWNQVGKFQTIDVFWVGLYILIIGGELSDPGAYGFNNKPRPEIPGDHGWDPLGLRPKDAKGLMEMQNKELNTGRLAMLAAAGMIAQELVTGKPIFSR
jgi:hypothetical protein